MPRTSGNLRGLGLDLSSSFSTLSSPISSFHTQPPSHVTHHLLLSEPPLLLLLVVLGLCNNVQTSDADDHTRCPNYRPLIIFYPSYIFRSSYPVNAGTQALVDTAFPCSIFHHPCHLALSVQLPLKFFYRPSSTSLPLVHVQELVCRQQVGTDSRHHLITMSNGATPSSSALYVTSSPHRSRHSHRSLFSTLSLHKPCTYFSTQYTYFLASSYRPRHRSIFVCCRFLVAPSMVCLVPV